MAPRFRLALASFMAALGTALLCRGHIRSGVVAVACAILLAVDFAAEAWYGRRGVK